MKSNIMLKVIIETKDQKYNFNGKGLVVKASRSFVAVDLDGSLVAGSRVSDVVKWVVEQKKEEE